MSLISSSFDKKENKTNNFYSSSSATSSSSENEQNLSYSSEENLKTLKKENINCCSHSSTSSSSEENIKQQYTKQFDKISSQQKYANNFQNINLKKNNPENVALAYAELMKVPEFGSKERYNDFIKFLKTLSLNFLKRFCYMLCSEETQKSMGCIAWNRRNCIDHNNLYLDMNHNEAIQFVKKNKIILVDVVRSIKIYLVKSDNLFGNTIKEIIYCCTNRAYDEILLEYKISKINFSSYSEIAHKKTIMILNANEKKEMDDLARHHMLTRQEKYKKEYKNIMLELTCEVL